MFLLVTGFLWHMFFCETPLFENFGVVEVLVILTWTQLVNPLFLPPSIGLITLLTWLTYELFCSSAVGTKEISDVRATKQQIMKPFLRFSSYVCCEVSWVLPIPGGHSIGSLTALFFRLDDVTSMVEEQCSWTANPMALVPLRKAYTPLNLNYPNFILSVWDLRSRI